MQCTYKVLVDIKEHIYFNIYMQCSRTYLELITQDFTNAHSWSVSMLICGSELLPWW